MSKWAKKRDKVEREIITALEAEGILVQQLDGSGVPDLLCCTHRGLLLLEVKDAAPGKKAHRRNAGPLSELTPSQVKFWAKWGARTGIDLFVVHTPVEAIIACGFTP